MEYVMFRLYLLFHDASFLPPKCVFVAFYNTWIITNEIKLSWLLKLRFSLQTWRNYLLSVVSFRLIIFSLCVHSLFDYYRNNNCRVILSLFLPFFSFFFGGLTRQLNQKTEFNQYYSVLSFSRHKM